MRQVGVTTERERRRDTHEKIQLGALIKKAKLGQADPVLIFGALMVLRESLDREDTDTLANLKAIGERYW